MILHEFLCRICDKESLIPGIVKNVFPNYVMFIQYRLFEQTSTRNASVMASPEAVI